MSAHELKDCPCCGGGISFHQGEDCTDGCHHLHCSGMCGMYVDLSPAVDPKNECETLEELRARIAEHWNRHSGLIAATRAVEHARFRSHSVMLNSATWKAARALGIVGAEDTEARLEPDLVLNQIITEYCRLKSS